MMMHFFPIRITVALNLIVLALVLQFGASTGYAVDTTNMLTPGYYLAPEGSTFQVEVDTFADVGTARLPRGIELGFERTPDFILVPDEGLGISGRGNGLRTCGHKQPAKDDK